MANRQGVYLLIEFQSRVDRYMAVRILTYLGLLYQELIRSQSLTAVGKRPSVRPVVLYNGFPRWQAATEVADLVESVPGGLEQYCPRLRYLLVDEVAVDESDALALRNLVAALFRLEKSRAPQDLRDMVGALVEWLKAPEQVGLRRAFTVWIKRVLQRQLIRRFGDLPEWVVSRLAQADLEELEVWAERVLDAGTLEDVFR